MHGSYYNWEMPMRRDLDLLATQPFDVLVIGGGITGAGIARDAALRGLTVALVDKGDFASGTSSRSSRLVHGGVRYLEHGHFHLVFEASAERRRLLRLAPHLVRPLAFTWPVYAGQRLPVWKLAAGLTLYDALSLFRNVERHRRLRASDVVAWEPSLATSGLRGGVRYFDAATDDARLTLANALDAHAAGAVLMNHVAVTGSAGLRDGLRVLRVEDAISGTRGELRARVVVNAGGPWSEDVLGRLGVPGIGRVRGSKGSHIAVPRARIGNRAAVTLTHPVDGRVMFALPAGAHTIVGTTDKFTDESPDAVRAGVAEVQYLLDAANTLFPDARLTRDDVVAAWSGIRPLVPTGQSSVAASREHALTRGDGIVGITGGKLTTYRVMASQATDAAQQMIGRRVVKSPTRDRVLHGGDVDVAAAVKEAARVTSDAARAAHLVHAYGREWRDVHALCERDDASRESLVEGLPYRMGEVAWSVEHEVACTLGDLLIRRTHVAFETRDNGRAVARRVAAFLGWPAAELERYEAEVLRIFAITP
jgi:glycerol-3-phosphate dehydrogenase